LEQAITEISENSGHAVVGISKYKKTIFGQDSLEYTGSGVVYDCKAVMKDGSIVSNCETTIDSNQVLKYEYLVITNRHVIEEKEKNVRLEGLILKIYLGDENEEIGAELIDYHRVVDLAVLKFSHSSYIQPLRFGDSDKLKIGNFVIAIGNPAGHEYYGTTTFGIVSGPKRFISDVPYIQHDAAINSGNSGGALVNLNGELIGINTLKLTTSDIDNIYENMGFAIPANLVWEIVRVLDGSSKD
jgi:serine protease Do